MYTPNGGSCTSDDECQSRHCYADLAGSQDVCYDANSQDNGGVCARDSDCESGESIPKPFAR